MKSNQPLLGSNDSLRTRGIGGKVVITPDVFCLGMSNITKVISLIKNYDTIEENQSSGNVTFDGKEIFWKIKTITTRLQVANTDVVTVQRVLKIYLQDDII